MILHIIKVIYIEDYKVEVSFNDGRKGVANLEAALHGPVFEPLKDKDLFSQVKLDDSLNTICWPNGADLAPEYVYFKAFCKVPELQTKFKEWGYLAS